MLVARKSERGVSIPVNCELQVEAAQ